MCIFTVFMAQLIAANIDRYQATVIFWDMLQYTVCLFRAYVALDEGGKRKIYWVLSFSSRIRTDIGFCSLLDQTGSFVSWEKRRQKDKHWDREKTAIFFQIHRLSVNLRSCLCHVFGNRLLLTDIPCSVLGRVTGLYQIYMVYRHACRQSLALLFCLHSSLGHLLPDHNRDYQRYFQWVSRGSTTRNTTRNLLVSFKYSQGCGATDFDRIVYTLGTKICQLVHGRFIKRIWEWLSFQILLLVSCMGYWLFSYIRKSRRICDNNKC